ncbi:extracellular solute-binding protein [Demequina oxidasica]|uniref:extracellular solute-binding protein n=1 Tax=Demequina oxidasica TaxID=676199 RepID=UPI000785F4CF|nr:extracellular solute-binding protein [Demequina oxidasica]
MKKTMIGAAAATAATALVLAGCSTSSDEETTAPTTEASTGATDEAMTAESADITLWLMGGDTNEDLRQYLKDTYAEENGGTLTIEEQGWGDALAKLTTALPDSANTPDVTEIGNTWSPTFTAVGAFSDLTDMYDELGGDSLLQSFVEVGKKDDKNFAMPYYFGSRSIIFRKDIYDAAGVAQPTTLQEFNDNAAKLKTDDMSGFYLGGSDWRNGISWIFANGGDLAKQEDGQWVSTLSDPNTQKGLKMLQDLYTSSSNAPVGEFDSTPWVNINNNESTGKPEAATIMAPNWAHWSVGLTSEDDNGDVVVGDDGTTPVLTWDDDTFGTFALPGVDGGIAPVFAGGSNIGVSAASENQDAAKQLMSIIFSDDYQTMLAGAGLGPANLDFTSALGDDQFAKVNIEAASGSKLTPAAPGWAAVEGSSLLEEFFGKVNAGGDIAALATEYDAQITPMLNG